MPDTNLNSEEPRYEVQTMADDLKEARSALKNLDNIEQIQKTSEVLKTPQSSVESQVASQVNIPPTDIPIAKTLKEEPSKPVMSTFPSIETEPVSTEAETPSVAVTSSFFETEPEPSQKIFQPEELKQESFIKRRLKLKIGIIILVGVALGLAAIYYVIPILKPTKTPMPTISKTPTPIIVESILNLDINEKISLINNTTEELFNILSALAAEPLTETEEKMEELLIISQTSGDKKLNLINIFETLNIIYPQELFSIIDNNYYEIFLYSAKDKADLGFVIEISNENVNSLKDVLANWENTMIDSFKPFLFGRAKNPDSFNFKDNNYKGAKIRYINLNTPEVSIDYAIYTDFIKNKTYWIFTTSKDSMFTAIDRIVQTSQ